jgi:hypothetical protein
MIDVISMTQHTFDVHQPFFFHCGSQDDLNNKPTDTTTNYHFEQVYHRTIQNLNSDIMFPHHEPLNVPLTKEVVAKELFIHHEFPLSIPGESDIDTMYHHLPDPLAFTETVVSTPEDDAIDAKILCEAFHAATGFHHAQNYTPVHLGGSVVAEMPQQIYTKQFDVITSDTATTSTATPTQGLSPSTDHIQNLAIDRRSKAYDRIKKSRKSSNRICHVHGCTKGIRSRGLCKAHGGGRRCTFEGCKNSDQGGGYCIAHGGGKRCSKEGCIKSAQSRGLCKTHGGGLKCKIEFCTKNGQVKGLCRVHYNLTLKV